MSGTKEVQNAHDIMRTISTRLVREKREAAIHKGPQDHDQRDLLSLLIQSNADASIPERERLTDKDILARKLAISHVSGRSPHS